MLKENIRRLLIIKYNEDNMVSNIIVKVHYIINADQLLSVSTEDQGEKSYVTVGDY